MSVNIADPGVTPAPFPAPHSAPPASCVGSGESVSYQQQALASLLGSAHLGLEAIPPADGDHIPAPLAQRPRQTRHLPLLASNRVFPRIHLGFPLSQQRRYRRLDSCLYAGLVRCERFFAQGELAVEGLEMGQVFGEVGGHPGDVCLRSGSQCYLRDGRRLRMLLTHELDSGRSGLRMTIASMGGNALKRNGDSSDEVGDWNVVDRFFASQGARWLEKSLAPGCYDGIKKVLFT
jgi:hypothetical protein